MDNRKMGQFIAGLRKEKHLTQKELADRLHITDKAVSKWERGLSCPDIALLSNLAQILDITVDELLNAEKNSAKDVRKEVNLEAVIDLADQSLESRVKKVQKICAAVYSALLFAGAVVCVICDLAVSGGLAWSMIPVCSILFAWAVLFPVIRFGIKGVKGTLLALSVLTLPYLYTLTGLIKDAPALMPRVSRRVTVVALILVWAVYGLFRVFRQRKLLAAALSFLISVPACFAINFSLSKILGIPMVDKWDIPVAFLLLTVAVFFLVWDKKRQSR